MNILKDVYKEKLNFFSKNLIFQSKNSFFQCKRGQLVYEALLVMIASGIIIAAFVSAGKSYGSQEAFYKLAVARDLALTIDLLYGLPGDVIYAYPNDVSDYYIEVNENTIKIYNKKLGKQDPTVAKHSLAGLGTYTINKQIKDKKFVRLEKFDNEIKITGVDE